MRLLLLMMFLVAASCMVASARRLWMAIAPTSLDLALLSRIFSAGSQAIAPLSTAIADDPAMEWETGLLVAARAPVQQRSALLNEQVDELEFRLQKWARVPRVCASIATSSAFLLATIALRSALAQAGDGDVGAAFDGAIYDAISMVILGIAAAAFSIAAYAQAQKIVKARRIACDELIEKIGALV